MILLLLWLLLLLPLLLPLLLLKLLLLMMVMMMVVLMRTQLWKLLLASHAKSEVRFALGLLLRWTLWQCKPMSPSIQEALSSQCSG